ncbi:MAG: tetratricopeptide repeat protein [Magnetococcales bacterium]|nr:tetratricopeptide repeat protein [Magnetococcales bacterium]
MKQELSHDRPRIQVPANASLQEASQTLAELCQAGRLAEAEDLAGWMTRQFPGLADRHYDLGVILMARNLPAAAETAFREAARLDPAHALAQCNLGALLCDQEKFPEAETALRAALTARPAFPEALHNLAKALARQLRPEEAEAALIEALRLRPEYAGALETLGILLANRDAVEEAADAFRAALRIQPDLPMARGGLRHMAMHLCDWREEVHSQERGPIRLSPFAMLSLTDSGMEQRACATAFKPRALQPEPAMATSAGTDPQRLAIGYLSADFQDHPVALLLAGILEAHDRERFAITAYSLGQDDGGAMRRRVMAACDRFVDVGALSDTACAQRIAMDGIHILVDLQGFTRESRPEILARRPAPLVATWLGYPGTLGHPGLADYLIGDPIVTPPAHAAHFAETLALLPHCYLPNDRTRPIAATPSRAAAGLPEHGFVFCSFNAGYKFNPDSFAIWCRLLRDLPGSLLWLRRLPWPSAMTRLRDAARQHGIDPERILFAPKTPTGEEHLARLALADLALDTFPYNSHATGCDALWSGVPLLTRMGESLASRVGASLLSAVGLPELITREWESYAELAMELARHPQRLSSLRQRLWRNRTTSPLFDTAGFTRDLESLYERMWQQQRTGKRAMILPQGHEWKMLGTHLLQQGRTDEAATALREATRLLPDDATAWNNLGAALGRGTEAGAAFRQAISLAPRMTHAWYNLGCLLLGEGRLQEAESALRHCPDHAPACNNLGNLLKDLGRPDEAQTAFREAIRLAPDFAPAHFNLGLLLRETGPAAQAEAAFRAVIDLQPDNALAHANLGALLRQQGHHAAAEAAFLEALRLDPACAATRHGLGLLLREQRRPTEAEAAFRAVLRLEPENVEALCNLGLLLHEQNRPEEAEPLLRRAIQRQPDCAEAHLNLGILLRARLSHDASASALREAIRLQPDLARAHNNLGITLNDQNRLTEAEAAFREACRRDPAYADARWNLSLLLLRQGRFAEGWPLYESRWQPGMEKPVARLPDHPAPLWQGEALTGKSLLVFDEQGFGDTIQFCRFLPELLARGATRITLVCRPALTALMETLPGITVTATRDTLPPHDYRTLLLSIPRWLETIPASLPYLAALDERENHWRGIVPQDGLRVGLTWKGSLAYPEDRKRSLPSLATLAPLWQIQGVRFVSLQKGPGEEEADHPPANQPIIPAGGRIRDFADTAWLISRLDLVISVDSAVAHLCGALGKPCLLLLPGHGADWRWLTHRTDSPWYPQAMRIIRQKQAGDWSGAVAEAARELSRFAASVPPGR